MHDPRAKIIEFLLVKFFLFIILFLVAYLSYNLGKAQNKTEEIVSSQPVYCEQKPDNCLAYVEDIKGWIEKHDKIEEQWLSCTLDLSECQNALHLDNLSIDPSCQR